MHSGVSLEAAARELLQANTQTAVKDGRTYTFSVPSPQAYPFQWFWDSCFHAITWARFEAERAAEELRALFAWQGRDGFIPHVIFWNRELASRNPTYWHFRESRPWLRRPRTTARVQPPVIAQAVERVVDAGAGDAFLQETIEPLERYYRYLAAARDPDGDSLLTIISSYESGLDHSPVYDHPFSLHVDDADPLQADPWWKLRREFVNKLFGHRAGVLSRIRRSTHEDVHFTSIYAQGLRSLARLADRARDDALARWSRETASGVTDALMERSYDARAGLFWNLVGTRQDPVRVKTIVSLMPLILDDLPRAAVESVVEHLANPDEFWLDYPVASTAKDEPAFAPGRTRLIWRGPMSMNTNWFLAHGLRAHGYPDLADTIAERSRELVERHGFNEFYNPLTGEPVGVETFGWATLVLDL
jgi:hypothetical protein